ncbi:MAG: hypothetical protein ACJ8KU_10055 [Chthoniobacterales bacterium]
MIKPFRSIFLAALAVASVSLLSATTVIPPTFDQLLSQAELIFQGTVTNVESRWEGEGANRHIQSYVTLKVDDKIKGAPGNNYTISMLGGTVGDETMEVTDAPRFKVGDRDFLFVEHNGSQFIPLVGIMHGRFRLQHDQVTGREFVATNDGAPLVDVDQLGKDEHAASNAAGTPLTPQAFKSVVQTRLARLPQ